MHAFKIDLMTVLVLAVILGIVLTMSLGSSTQVEIIGATDNRAVNPMQLRDPVAQVKYQTLTPLRDKVVENETSVKNAGQDVTVENDSL